MDKKKSVVFREDKKVDNWSSHVYPMQRSHISVKSIMTLLSYMMDKGLGMKGEARP